jgi:hypothetical protein
MAMARPLICRDLDRPDATIDDIVAVCSGDMVTGAKSTRYRVLKPERGQRSFSSRDGRMEMPQVKGDDEAYEDRLVILEELGIEENALEHDESTDEVSASSDEAAIKRFFARAFREWAEGNVEGTAQEIFDAVVTLLDSD